MTNTISSNVKFVNCESFHSRHGAISNAFRYRLDCLLVPAHEAARVNSRFLQYNKRGLFSFYDKDHGDGRPVSEFADFIAEERSIPAECRHEIWLLTQPRILGYVFNPVSFWFFLDRDKNLRVVLAEVNNTVKGRHFYLCHHDDFAPINRQDSINVEKVFHVSPFQEVRGEYTFKFHFGTEKIGTWIDFRNGPNGVYATMTGRQKLLSDTRLLKSAILRPLGALRVITLIHWQALKLKLKGGRFRKAPLQNKERITR